MPILKERISDFLCILVHFPICMAEFDFVSVRADPPRAGVDQRTRAFLFLFIPGCTFWIISFCIELNCFCRLVGASVN